MTEPKHIGKYAILGEIGRGGFATVYEARDTEMGRNVALKVIHNAPNEAAFVQRFQQEARIAANLRHPNIVPVHDFGDADGALYLAMALIGAGRTLRSLLVEQPPLCLEHALPILAQLADALDYLHRHEPSLTHRDVKPSNVLLEEEGDNLWVVLTDFGLVHSMEASAELTKSGTILGTPAYMAPEQADPKQWGQVTPLTDVYALGVIAYEMLVGRQPFVGELATVLHAHAYEEPPVPLENAPGLGDDVSAVLLHALAKPPAERYPSAGALVATLRKVADARITAAARDTTLEQLEAQARALLGASEWLEALDRCTQMVRLDPDWPAALEMLTAAKEGLDREQAEAMKRRRLEERYAQGLQLLQEEKWKLAITALDEVVKDDPDFRDVQDRLVQARDELQRAQWYDEAIAYGKAERWAATCRTWAKVLRGRLDYRGGEVAERLLDATDGLLYQHDTLAQKLEQLESEHSTLVQKLRQLESERKDLKKGLEQLESERDGLIENVRDLGHQAAEAKQWIDELDKSLDQHDKTVKKLRQLESERDELLLNVDTLKRKVTELEQQASTPDENHEALIRFDALAGAAESRDWEKVVQIGESVLRLEPDLDGVHAWLSRARYELAWLPELSHGQATRTGSKLTRNETTIVALEFDAAQNRFSVPIGLYLVASGMGNDGGDLTGRAIQRVVTDWVDKKRKADIEPAKIIAYAIEQANEALYRRSKTENKNLGATVTAALIVGSDYFVANVGYNRTYLLREGQLNQVTVDHSLVQRLVEQGQITPEEAANHPQRNVIYRSLGDREVVTVDKFYDRFHRNDQLILCSDELWKKVSDSQILRTVEQSHSPQDACDTLVRAANQAGAEWPTAVVLVKAGPS